jgi:hypothetical protein
MIEDPQIEPTLPGSRAVPDVELDDENGIAAQAVRQGAGDTDPEAPLPDDGSGIPLHAEETLSVEDDVDAEAADDDAIIDEDEAGDGVAGLD